MKRKINFLFWIFSVLLQSQIFAGNYKDFAVSVYVRAYEVREMDNLQKLNSLWNIISSQVKVDKIYLETHRDKIIVNGKTIETVKKYFLDKGKKILAEFSLFI